MDDSDRQRSRRVLLLFVLGLYTALTLPKLLTVGLFQDGVVFASVARNMAEGVGGFWTPRFTDTAYSLEFMHPPLGPWLLSHVFRVFGDWPRLEVFYGIGVGLINLALLACVWRTATRVPERDDRSGAWLPLALYVTMPLTSHSYTSNLLESPMTSFVLLAVITSHLAVFTRKRSRLLGLSLLTGILVCLAIQTKGPAAAFVLTYPVALALVHPGQRPSRGFAVAAFAFGATAAATAAVILPNESARSFTRHHYQGLVLFALEGGNIPSQGRFSVLRTTLQESLVPVVLILVGARALRLRPQLDRSRRDLAFLLTGLAGTLPYLVTTHQYSRYALPALPMFAVGLAFLSQGLGERLELGLARHGRQLVTAAALILVISGTLMARANAGTVRKHEAFHADFTLQPLQLEGRPLLSTCPEGLTTDWVLVGDLQRYLRASLTTESGHEFWLTAIRADCVVPEGCELIHPPQSTTYQLYRCHREVGSRE